MPRAAGLAEQISWDALCDGLRCEGVGSAELAVDELYS